MTISLLLKTATGALFLNASGSASGTDGAVLQGFVDFTQGEGDPGGRIRFEGTARLAPIRGPQLRYLLSLGRGLFGFMLLETDKRAAGDPDYTGCVGLGDELLVSGWNRSSNGRSYVLLNVRENPAVTAVRQLSSI